MRDFLESRDDEIVSSTVMLSNISHERLHKFNLAGEFYYQLAQNTELL